jgi:hypothetical protein
MSQAEIQVCWTLDCEATQRSVMDVELGRRAINGFVDCVVGAGMRATLLAIPGDARAYAPLLRSLASDDVEIGLHYHPQEEGRDDFCGAYDAGEQRAMYAEGRRQFADALGFSPQSFRTGSCSANDATFPVTAELGFTSCSHSMPGRNMVNLRSNWVGAPDHVHFAHPANRLLEGGLDLVEIPVTTDPDSMMWSGGHPQDLRVELFDGKNQRYLIDKMIDREKHRPKPIKALVALSHNVFDFADRHDFRRQTLEQMLAACRESADRHEVCLRAATLSQLADRFRSAHAPGSQASRNGPIVAARLPASNRT